MSPRRLRCAADFPRLIALRIYFTASFALPRRADRIRLLEIDPLCLGSDGAMHILMIAVMASIARLLERRWPIAITPLSEVIDDWKTVFVNLALTALLAPLTTVCSGIILSTLGHGWIPLPTHGYWYLLSLMILVVITDLYHYAFHRLEHAIPFLWA